MYTSSQRWILTGIISFSPTCGNSNQPSVNTKIMPILQWLQSMNVTGSVSIDVTSTGTTGNVSGTTTVSTATTRTSSTTTSATTNTMYLNSTAITTSRSLYTTSKNDGCPCLLKMTSILFVFTVFLSMA